MVLVQEAQHVHRHGVPVRALRVLRELALILAVVAVVLAGVPEGGPRATLVVEENEAVF